MQGSEYDFAKANCVEFMPDGKSVVSGWTDGKIRAFLPQSGKLFWVINNAHKSGAKDYGGVTCLAISTDCNNVITGGDDFEVRVWDIGIQTKKLQSAQLVHQAPITQVLYIEIQDQNYVASSSLDGKIILWKLKKLQILQQVQTFTVPVSMKQGSSQPENSVGIVSMVYIPLSQNIACIDMDKKVTYINLETNKLEKQLQAAYDG